MWYLQGTRKNTCGEAAGAAADGSADDAVAMRADVPLLQDRGCAWRTLLCDPNQLIATKRRNKLAAADEALCYLTRGSFKEDQHTGFTVIRFKLEEHMHMHMHMHKTCTWGKSSFGELHEP